MILKNIKRITTLNWVVELCINVMTFLFTLCQQEMVRFICRYWQEVAQNLQFRGGVFICKIYF